MEANSTDKIELLYYSTGNTITVKTGWKGSYSYAIGTHQYIRQNKGEDRERFPLIISAHFIEQFLYTNDVKSEDLVIHPDSVDDFYMFDATSTRTRENLTDSFVKTWWDYDLPTLYKCNPNKNGDRNMLGEVIPCFSFPLIESSFMSYHIDKRLTEKEAKALTKCREHTLLHQEIASLLKSRGVDDTKLRDLEKYVEEFDDQLQTFINNHTPEILERLSKLFDGTVEVENGEKKLRINKSFGFDCGFHYIYTADENYNEAKRILKHQDKHSDHVNVSMPYMTQSLTVMKEQFEIVKELVQKNLGYSLWQKTILD